MWKCLLLKSTVKLPYLMQIGNPKVYPIDYYQNIVDISYISRERMVNVGYNKFLRNTIYCSLSPDEYLYFKSCNPQFLYLEKVRMTAIFSDTKAASDLKCDLTTLECDIMERKFPLEDALIPVLTELILKELAPSIYKPDDTTNDAKDNNGDLQKSSNGRG
jgi:hypothetical protein